jgi:hypothetical protein
MKSIDRILENVQKEVELYGRSGSDCIFIDNYQFSIDKNEFSVPMLANEDEGVNDVAWFFTCARKGIIVPHPNPDRSFWIKLFGKDANPYGPTWNVDKLLETLRKDGKQRQAVFNNGLFTTQPPCILTYQFQNLEYGYLDLTVTMRSSDVSSVLPQDVFMSRVILEQIASRTGMEPGKMTFFIANAHVFYKDTLYNEEYTIDYGD